MRALLLVLCASCALTTSFDYDTVDRPSPTTYAVHVTVTGLEDSTVTLRLNGGGDLVASNGDFVFSTRVADGAGYVVTAEADHHTCAVENGSGNIAAADVAVAVKCASTNADLASLVLSRGSLVPAFDPKTAAYAAAEKTSEVLFPPTSITIAAMAKSSNATIVVTPSMPISVGVGATTIDVAVTAADRLTTKHYTIDVTGRVADYIKASNATAQYGFGRKLAFDGDTLAVGELDSSGATGIGGDPNDTSAKFAGSVHVFTRTNGAWSEQAYVKASNTRADAEFGGAVALSGNTLAVGSPCEHSNATGVGGNQNDASLGCAGAVYVFVRTGTTWTQQAYIKASDTSESHFGEEIALAGDTLVVGATYVTPQCGIRQGGAYVFQRANGTWSQTVEVTPAQSTIDEACNYGFDLFFGSAVAVSGDESTIAVGSPEDGGMGNVYVYGRSGMTWTEKERLVNPEVGDSFGASLALSSSGDTMAIGAPNASSYEGAAWIFVRNGTFSQQARLAASNANPQVLALFGYRVALSASGDLLAVGAPEEASAAMGINGDQTDKSSKNAGAAYVLARSGMAWTQRAYVKATNAKYGPGLFGQALAISPDTLVVGAWYEGSSAKGLNGDQTSTSAPIAGAVFVY